MHSKVRAMAANEGRCPIPAQCRLPGVARSTYRSMRSRPDRTPPRRPWSRPTPPARAGTARAR